MLPPEVITWMVCGLSFKAFLLQTLEILLSSTECGLMLETSIPLKTSFHIKLQDYLISVACSGFITPARGRSFPQGQRERACSAGGSQQAWEMLTQREDLCSSHLHIWLMGRCWGLLPLPFGERCDELRHQLNPTSCLAIEMFPGALPNKTPGYRSYFYLIPLTSNLLFFVA